MMDEEDEILPDGKRSFHQFMGIKSRKKTILKALLIPTWKYTSFKLDHASLLANPESLLLMFYENLSLIIGVYNFYLVDDSAQIFSYKIAESRGNIKKGLNTTIKRN